MNGGIMEKRDRDKLRSNRVALVQSLKVDEILLSFLITKRILNEDMKEEITEVYKTRSSRAGALLDMLPRRGPYAFRAFVEGLVKSDAGSVADLLDKTCADNYRRQSHRPVDAGYPEGPPVMPVYHERVDLPPTLLDTESTFLDVGKMRNSTPTFIQSTLANVPKYCYPVTSPRGKAIILNIEKFQDDKHSERQGSSTDVVNIKNTFERLSFVVDVVRDPTADEIWEKVQEQNNPENVKYDAFCMFMLSHGKEGLIYSSDNKDIIIADLVANFDGDHCKNLVGKPKMFFIQACQETEEATGLKADGDDKLDEEKRTISSMGADAETQVHADAVEMTWGMIHEKADILLAHSTVPGYKSWRHRAQGSWFMRDIAITFIQRADQDDVASMMTKVNGAIKERSQDSQEGFIQTCEYRTSLSQDVYLLPGYTP